MIAGPEGRESAPTARTVVAFHAHPDDEALLTAGTMARAAAEGHRVVMVVATDGDPGSNMHAADVRLGCRRLAEARESARVLGVARVEHLGYADSGLGPETYPDPPGQARFVRVPIEEAAQRLAAILREERADVLLSHDRNGGYGHRDHLRVHEVGARAAELAGTPRILEATIPRDAIHRAAVLASKVYRFAPGFDRSGIDHTYSARSEITHRISVRHYAAQKRASLRAHASQTAADTGADRALATLLRIPRPLYDLVTGWEWYVDPDHYGPVSRDIFEGLC
jgi:LmbE family N-acetylglucosaminyl deacetylase